FAASRSSASSRSRVSRATSVSSLGTKEPRAPTDSGALRRFGVTALWRCDLADLPPALERRLIAFPKAQDKASRRFKLAHWKRPGAVLCVTANFDRECPLWAKSGHCAVSGRCPLYPQQRTSELSHGMSALCQ